MVVVPARSPSPGIELHAVERVEALIIDKQPLFLAALASLLEAPPRSARVVTALRSDVGLDIARTPAIGVVFCELRAEPISGVELVRVLATEGCTTPVVLLADDGDEAQLAAAVAMNVAGAFSKSSPLDEFLVGVRAVVSGHRAIGSGLLVHLIEGSTASRGYEPKRFAGRLSPTELAILGMIGQALSIPDIAANRGISHKTVRNHLAKIYRKLELHGRTEAMLWAARMGLTGS